MIQNKITPTTTDTVIIESTNCPQNLGSVLNASIIQMKRSAYRRRRDTVACFYVILAPSGTTDIIHPLTCLQDVHVTHFCT